ncbi:MAG: radical SAM protein [Myxococcales bacterium]|nr:radical SAM protein [Myxococcales bacterium]
MLELFEKIGFAPRRCTWEITLACNLRCGHCGSRAGRARDDELSHDEALRVVDELSALGCRHVTLAGGEPTLRPDWAELIARFRARGVRCSMISNGLTWSEKLARRAKAAGLHHIGFSLDGLERSHDCVRKVPRGYKKVLRAIDISVAHGMTVVAVTHLTRRNVCELEALHAVLAEHGVAIWQLQLGVPMGNMREDRAQILEPAAILDIVPRIAAINDRGRAPRVIAADNIGYFGEHEENVRGAPPGTRIPFWVGCRAGLDVMGLESNGNVKGCLSLPSGLNGCSDFVEGNVRERSLREIWHDPNAFAYNRKFSVDKLSGKCRGCEFGEICRGGCTWTSFSHHGEAHAFPSCYYHEAKARASQAATAASARGTPSSRAARADAPSR